MLTTNARDVRTGLAAAALIFAGISCASAQDWKFDERPALPFPPTVSVQSQCGAVNDLQDVERYDGTLGVSTDYVHAHEPSTVQFQWMDESSITSRLPDYSPGNVAGVRWCTGTLFTDRLVLTAGHCFDVQRNEVGWVSPWKIGANGKPEYATSEMIATLQVANFGYQVDKDSGAIRVPKVYAIASLVEHRRGDLDYSIVELRPDADGKFPGATITPAVISPGTPFSSVGDALAIIQHPQGLPKKIGTGHLLDASNNSIFYNDIDTWGGSSGSGVADADGKIIGVHTNGGCTLDPNSGANRGVDIRAIAAVSSKF